MFKKFVSSLVALVLVCGCSSSSVSTASAELDIKATAKQLVSDIGLTDTMDELSNDRQVMGLFLFDTDTVSESSVYIANNQSADIIGIFKTSNVDSCKASIKTYLENQKAQMQNYYPDEVFKIDNAYLEDNGTIVILAVCKDIELAKKKADAILGK